MIFYNRLSIFVLVRNLPGKSSLPGSESWGGQVTHLSCVGPPQTPVPGCGLSEFSDKGSIIENGFLADFTDVRGEAYLYTPPHPHRAKYLWRGVEAP